MKIGLDRQEHLGAGQGMSLAGNDAGLALRGGEEERRQMGTKSLTLLHNSEKGSALTVGSC